MDYTITLTESQNKALEYVALDINEWISNFTENRSNKAIDEICQIYINYKLDNNEVIESKNRDEMVIAAFNEGIIKTARERMEELKTNQ